jgi:hypothetical protein
MRGLAVSLVPSALLVLQQFVKTGSLPIVQDLPKLPFGLLNLGPKLRGNRFHEGFSPFLCLSDYGIHALPLAGRKFQFTLNAPQEFQPHPACGNRRRRAPTFGIPPGGIG